MSHEGHRAHQGIPVLFRALAISAALLHGWPAAVHAAGDADARLIEAARLGQSAAVRTLLAHQHADANAREVDGTTALHWAVRSDDRRTVAALIEAGARVDTANRYGVTPIALAATNGSADVVAILLQSGADANTASPEGETVLMTAARTGSRAAVKALLDRGARVNAREAWFGETALMWAAAENHPDVVELLLERGAEIDARSVPLEFAKFRFNLATMVNTVLPRGSLTALMLAARQGALQSARVLVDGGAALNLTDPDHTTAMVTAIINGHYDVAALLVERGADPNIGDNAGMAAVYALVDMRTEPFMINRPTRKPSGQVSDVTLLKQLLAHGADPNAPLKTPILARYHNIGDAQLGAGATPLMRAARSRDVEAMRLLLDSGADVKPQAANGATALMFAATPPRGTAVGAASAALSTSAPSDEAVLDAVRLCLDRGADINAVNANGQTALHLAAPAGQADAVVKLLLSRGANPEIRDKQGRTALDQRP
jgi:ankyrin repeat protein